MLHSLYISTRNVGFASDMWLQPLRLDIIKSMLIRQDNCPLFLSIILQFATFRDHPLL
jgi:predicted 2-oxoglutarate/Fe(II)-dependent dioxygenase YbiX